MLLFVLNSYDILYNRKSIKQPSQGFPCGGFSYAQVRLIKCPENPRNRVDILVVPTLQTMNTVITIKQKQTFNIIITFVTQKSTKDTAVSGER